jgi:hypothetical protein
VEGQRSWEKLAAGEDNPPKAGKTEGDPNRHMWYHALRRVRHSKLLHVAQLLC